MISSNVIGNINSAELEIDPLTFFNVPLFIFPRDAPVGHRRGNNPVEYVIFFFVTRSHKKQCRILIPRDAPVGHRRGNNPVEYVIFFFVTRSHKKQCRILIEV